MRRWLGGASKKRGPTLPSISDRNSIEGVGSRVEVQIQADAVVGTVATWGEQPRTFTAHRASGDAGLCRADQVIELDPSRVDGDSALAIREQITDPTRQAMLRGDWIVRQDGRQRGAVILNATPSLN